MLGNITTASSAVTAGLVYDEETFWINVAKYKEIYTTFPLANWRE